MLNLIDFVKTESVWRPSQQHPITVSFLTLFEQKAVELNNKQPDNGGCNTKHNVVNFKNMTMQIWHSPDDIFVLAKFNFPVK